MVGQSVAHYTILEKLGEGGMGVVYKARDTHLDRLVAIKVLPPEKMADPERKRRFVQEAKAASALNHPNIITIYDIDTAAGVDFIAMEYVAGKPLDEIIGRKGLKLKETLQYSIQVADGLAAAHAAGIVHRDLKPGNVMVNDNQLVKVLDFGLAKLSEPTAEETTLTQTLRPRTEEGRILGTVSYMSPEQAEAKPVDTRSDIFSFGAMLYEMVTGQRAFQGDSQASTLAAILRGEPKAASQAADEVPRDLEKIIARCLRKERERRFQHMDDVKVALEEIREESISGSLAAEHAPPKRRHGLLWMALGVVVLAALGAGVWLGRSRRVGKEAPLTAVPLTSYAGHVGAPSFSPDGNQVAFVWDGEKQDNTDIYIKLIGPGAPLRLTSDPAQDVSPAWSPDGRSIAFMRFPAGRRPAILLIPALGGPERKLAEGMFVPGLAWSRDGQWLVVARREASQQPCGLFALSLATGEMRRLTEGSAGAWAGDGWPALSPDRRTLAFVRSMTRANSEIYLLPVSETLEPRDKPRQLTFENRAAGYPAWTPDSREIIFAFGFLGGGGRLSLMRIAADASPQTRASRVPLGEGGEMAAISPQGRLVFSHWVNDENVWRLPLENGNPGPPQRLIFSTRRDIEPRYSPDGRKIAFSSDRSGSNEVWICDADGSNPVQLTSMGAIITAGARWSPDGQRLAFLSSLEGQQEIYLISANGGRPVRLTRHPGHDSAPGWSHDGQWIYFASNRSGRFEVWKMPPDAKGTPVQITRNGGFAAIESADRKTLYYTKLVGGEMNGLWKVPVDGGPESLVIPLMGAWGDFDVTAKGIYYVSSRAAGAEIRLHSFATGAETTLGRFDKRPSFGLAAAPDDGSVLFTQYDTEATELVLIENFR